MGSCSDWPTICFTAAPPVSSLSATCKTCSRRRRHVAKGVGRALIEVVYRQAAQAGATRVYWQTQVTNSAGRLLYDKVAKHRGFIVYSHEVTGAA